MTDARQHAVSLAPLVVAARIGVATNGTVLLAPISLELVRGTSLAVLGANGSGKTTLLRVLAGVTSFTTGSLSVAGEPVNERDPAFRARVASLIGLPPLARNLTLREHLTLVAASWGHDLGESGDIADTRLAELDITALAARFPHELSSGQTQLFALALTLSRPFDLLLLDEPEQRLDPDRLDRVGRVLRRVVTDGAGLILASHSRALVDQVADTTVNVADAGHAHGR